MAATGVCSAMINLEALTKDNYKYWSFRVKTYLLAEDLWDLVEGSYDGEVEFKAWRKNNARALQAITILCGKDAESSIVYLETARDAWNTLAEKFKPPEILEEPEPDTNSIEGGADEVELNDEDTDSIEGGADETYDGRIHKPFFDDVRANRWEDVKEFLKHRPGAARLIEEDGINRWALHTALIYRSGDVVKALLPYLKLKDLEIVDGYGDNALSLAIGMHYMGADVTNKIVKCIVEKCIAEKYEKLLIRSTSPRYESIPLLFALSFDKLNKSHEYLYQATPIEKLKPEDAAELVSTYLRKKNLHMALELLLRFPQLAFTRDHSGEFPSYELVATRATLLTITSKLGLWKRLVYSCIIIPKLQPIHKGIGEVSIDCPEEGSEQGDWKHFIRKVTSLFGRLVANILHLFGIDDMYQKKLLDERTKEIMKCMCKVSNESNLGLSKEENEINLRERQHRKCFAKVLFQAVERGHAPFIRRLIDGNKRPVVKKRLGRWLRGITNAQGKTLFQFAAEHRQDKIFALIINFFPKEEERKEIIGVRDDKFGNNLLHVSGKLSPVTQIAHIRGAALQMQHELLWFKKVESMASPQDLDCINSDGFTPREVFTISHRDLVKEGELSMKETATSSSALVAALIITVMFAAAITVPGGIDGSTGIPIYLHNKAFKTFIVADVISLCSSTTSVMVFLGILTSRFAEEDFLTSLPTKLIVGFFTLFLSIGAMMVAFSSAIFIMLPENLSIIIPSIVLAGLPIASFIQMQFPFLLEIINSTYGPLEIFRRTTFRSVKEEIDYKIWIISQKLKRFF